MPAGVPSDAIFEAFREVRCIARLAGESLSLLKKISSQFVRVHQVLLNILIGKSGLSNTVPVIGAPVAAILSQIENVVDVSTCFYCGITVKILALLVFIY